MGDEMPKRSSLKRCFTSVYENNDYKIIEPINKMKDYCIDNKRLEKNLKYKQKLDTTQIHVLDDLD